MSQKHFFSISVAIALSLILMTSIVNETLQGQKAFGQILTSGGFKKFLGSKGLEALHTFDLLMLGQCTPFSQHMNNNFTHTATDGTTMTTTCEGALGSLVNSCYGTAILTPILSGEPECSDPRLLDFKTTYYDPSKYYNPIPTIITPGAGSNLHNGNQNNQTQSGSNNSTYIGQANLVIPASLRSTYRDSIGDLHIVGQVQNNFTFPIQFVQITGTVYDSSHQLVSTSDTYTNVNELGSGEKSGFDILLTNVPSDTLCQDGDATEMDDMAANNRPQE